MDRTRTIMKQTALALAALISLSGPALAGDGFLQDGYELYLNSGTLGTGVEANWRLDRNFGLRAGVNAGYFAFVNRDNGADLHNKAMLLNAGLTADYYPGGGDFRVSAGTRISANKVTGRVRNVVDHVKLFGRDVSVTIDDPLTRYTVTQNPLQPYLGGGYSHAFSERVTLNLDLGALYTGVPNLDVVSHAGRLGFSDRQIQAEIDKAVRRSRDYQFYPVVQIGFKVTF
jgi:hypothetical protein